MINQNDIIAEAADKLAMGRNCKTVKHCGVAGCDFATITAFITKIMGS